VGLKVKKQLFHTIKNFSVPALGECRHTEVEQKCYRMTWRYQVTSTIKPFIYKHVFGMNLYRVWDAHLAHVEKASVIYMCY
jgi:hypothetical protein